MEDEEEEVENREGVDTADVEMEDVDVVGLMGESLKRELQLESMEERARKRPRLQPNEKSGGELFVPA